jgi:Tfp pilus assembly protein PilF
MTDEIDALMREAAASHDSGDLAEADALYRRVLDHDPLHRDAIKHHVVIASKLGRPDDALAALETASRADPSDAEWPFGRALVLADSGRTEAAIAAYDEAIALRPGVFVYRQGRAGLLASIGRNEDALADHDAAIALRPDAVESHMARGALLERSRRFDEALAAYDRTIELQEDFAPAWFAKALLLLGLGRYEEGWPLYEWRWFIPGVAGQDRLFSQPMWDGTPLGGRTLYAHIEQGLGDSIQFYRFVLLAKRSGRIVLGVSERLAELFASQPDAPVVVATGQSMPHFDLYCPIGSLPWLLGVELNTLPRLPYLRADPARASVWEAKLAALQGRPRIGIAWTGNRLYAHDRSRSLSLEMMLEMLGSGATIVALQMGVPDTDQVTLRDATYVLDLSHSQENFADTAAVISQLDLVISVDTAVAHLAGAMGKPVWVLLSTSADWRWMFNREDSPWYPSARLFRQDKAGDWTGVASRVRRALEELIEA